MTAANAGPAVAQNFSAEAVSTTAATPPAATAPALYHEPYRPQFHYTPAKNWMNDPNGPIFYKGQYHLFYQYNPSGTGWGNISWGHAVSKDLVHWRELPLAIPQDDKEFIFSGGVVFDKSNTSGLGTAAHSPLVAIYTSARKDNGQQEQALASSTDGGLTWRKYAGNPVLAIGSNNFRDPKVFWYAPTKSWVMVVALSDQHKVSFYTSANLKNWTHQTDFGPAGAVGGQWECPNLVPLAVNGDRNNIKWVLVVGINPGGIAGGSGDQYFVGSFDGKRFISDDTGTYTPPTGTTFAGFDGATYAPWTTSGTAFGDAPATGPLDGQSTVDGVVGSGFVDSFHDHDNGTGFLTSPKFNVTSSYLNFKIGGGNHPHVDGSVIDPVVPTGTTFADFEGDTYGAGWTSTGDFVGTGPVSGAVDDQQQVTGFLGHQFVDTWLHDAGNGQPAHDANTGTITSPTFTISANYVDMLIGGGFHPYTGAATNPGEGATAVNLIVGGQVVRTATGANSEALDWKSWDVSALQGQPAQIQIVDENSGGWGHLNVDNIVFSAQAAQVKSRETAVNLLVNDKVVQSKTGSDNEALDWASFDLRAYQGQSAQVQISDQNTGGWGHINADQFTFTSAPALSSVQRAHWVDFGADFYAATTFNDVPGGRQILIGWMNNWNYAGAIPTSPWRSATSVPREMALQTINGKVQLTQKPVAQLQQLRTGKPVIAINTAIRGTKPVGINGATLELDGTFSAGSARQFGVNVHTGDGEYTQIGYDTETNEIYIDRTKSGNVAFDPSFAGVHRAPLALRNGLLHLHILVDTSSVEVFADRGDVVLTDQIFPSASSNGVSLFANGGTAKLVAGVGWHLKSAVPSGRHHS